MTYNEFINEPVIIELVNRLEKFEKYLGEEIEAGFLRQPHIRDYYNLARTAAMSYAFADMIYEAITTGWQVAYNDYSTC